MSVEVYSRTFSFSKDEWEGTWEDSLTDLAWCIASRINTVPGERRRNDGVKIDPGRDWTIRITFVQCRLSDDELVDLVRTVIRQRIARPSAYDRLRNPVTT